MKIVLEIGPEYAFVKEELEEQIIRAISEVASGSRPEYAAGFYACAVSVAEAIEGRYQNILQGPRAVGDDA